MKKLMFFVLLLSGPACAAWKSAGEDNNATWYADPATIAAEGNTAKMWSLLDYKSFQRMVEVGYFSQKAQAEYDCAAHKVRGLSVVLHAEKMGEGKVIYEDHSPHGWEDVAPGSSSEALWKIACSQ